MTKTRIAVGSVAICLLAVAVWHSHRERLFIFATGTSLRALSNATWLMSRQEVQRSNRCDISLIPEYVLTDPQDSVWSSFEIRTHSGVTFGGFVGNAAYYFWENRLIALTWMTGYSRDEPSFQVLDSTLVSTLEREYGVKPVAWNKGEPSYFVWDTNDLVVIYSSGGRQKKGASFQLVYKPTRVRWDELKGKFSTYRLYSALTLQGH